MRTYYIRRKDLAHVPFQFYVWADGTERPLDRGYTSTFAISPPKGEYDVVHVLIVADFARTLERQWQIMEADFVRLAAKALEAWVKSDPIPADHYYGPDFLKVDQEWYPAEPDGTPRLAMDPYNFEVTTTEPWPAVFDWPYLKQVNNDSAASVAEQAQPCAIDTGKRIVFGFTLDVFPGMLAVGYNQMKKKVSEAGIKATVSMLSLGDLPPVVDVLFVPPELAEAAQRAAPHSRVLVLQNFLNSPLYSALIQEWSGPAQRPEGVG